MLKFLLKLLAWVGAIAAALAALAYFDRAKANDYIEIYSDDEDDVFCVYTGNTKGTLPFGALT